MRDYLATYLGQSLEQPSPSRPSVILEDVCSSELPKLTQRLADQRKQGSVSFGSHLPIRYSEKRDDPRFTFLRELARDPDGWHDFETQMEERAAIMEIDGGLARDEALAQAEIITYEAWVN